MSERPEVAEVLESWTPPDLRWIVGEKHLGAWRSAAYWLHTNEHVRVDLVAFIATQRVHHTEPCRDCWRATAYAVKGVIMAGYGPQRQSE